METMNAKKIIEKIKILSQNYFFNKNLTNNYKYKYHAFEDLDEFLSGFNYTGEENISIEDISELILFMENIFELDRLNDEEYIEIIKEIKQIDLSLLSMRLKLLIPQFIPSNIIQSGNIEDLKIGSVLTIGDDVYKVRSEKINKTSKGYEIVVQSILKGEFSYVNNIYIDINNKCFFNIGIINEENL